ncbi:MAG: metallophosphoesterase [Solirubrobacteraceae bacterium]
MPHTTHIAVCKGSPPVRTLVVADFHLGARLRHDVLRHPEPLERLLDAIDDVERLVLLGDVVELMEGRARQSMAAAEPVLRALGERLGSEREVIIVPGNHDLPLVRSFVRARGSTFSVEESVPLDATPALARLAGWLAPARVRARYPGVWLSERVWATHGHYLDRHLLPDSAVGIARGPLGSPPREQAVPIDYERVRRPSVTRATSWLPQPLAALVDDLAELARATSMPRVPRRLLDPRIAPLTAMLLGAQMRHAGIPALARVVHRLGVDADWVLFGHVHRLGPLDGDDPLQWQAPGGRPRIVNTGSWLYEPLLLHRAQPPHPYWPGGAVLLEPGRDPRAVGLLDGLDADALR